MISALKISSKTLGSRKRAFHRWTMPPNSTIVLPPMVETLNKPTFKLLQQFIEQDGRIITFSAPTRIDGAVNDELPRLLTSATVTSLPKLSKDVIAQYFSSDNFRITFNSGNLYHHRRRFADGELVFSLTSSMDEVVDAPFRRRESHAGNGCLNGEIYTYPSSKERDILSISFRIEPAGSLLLYCSDKNPKNYPERPGKVGSRLVTATSRTTVSRLRDNALTIDFCDVTVKGETHKKQHFSRAADIAFKAHGFTNGNPWNTSVQYKRNILDRRQL